MGRTIRGWWRRSDNIKPVKWRHIFLGIAMLGALGLLIVALIQGVANDNVRQDREAALEQVYQSALVDHQKAVADYSFCLSAATDRVDTRDTVRDQLIAIAANGAQRSIEQAEGLRSAVLAILPDSVDARTAMDNYVQLATEAANRSIERAHASQDVEYPSLNVEVEQAKCVPPGPVPVNPANG
jgi:hypothetical protein